MLQLLRPQELVQLLPGTICNPSQWEQVSGHLHYQKMKYQLQDRSVVYSGPGLCIQTHFRLNPVMLRLDGGRRAIIFFEDGTYRCLYDGHDYDYPFDLHSYPLPSYSEMVQQYSEVLNPVLEGWWSRLKHWVQKF